MEAAGSPFRSNPDRQRSVYSSIYPNKETDGIESVVVRDISNAWHISRIPDWTTYRLRWLSTRWRNRRGSPSFAGWIEDRRIAGEGLSCSQAACPDLPRATMSNHYTILRAAGLVEARKDGVRVLHTFAPRRGRCPFSRPAGIGFDSGRLTRLRDRAPSRSSTAAKSVCMQGRMTGSPDTPLLDQVDNPTDLRKLKPEQLRQLADELRAEMICAVGSTGGHLGSGLGVVELTTAIHYVFNTPDDRLIFDVGHQAYPHKILTGRRDRIRTLRQGGGLSGFTKRSESEYDPFGAAHSSTSISAGLGLCRGEQAGRHAGQGDRRHRRRRDERGHGVRSDEQRRTGGQPADRDPERQRHVDRAAGGRPVRLSRAHGVEQRISRPADHGVQNGRENVAPGAQLARQGGRIHARHGDRRHVVRRAGLLLCRPDRRAQSRSSDARAGKCARQRAGAGADPCRHDEGQGLRPCRRKRRQISRRGEIRRGVGQTGQGAGRRPAILSERVRRNAGQAGRNGRPHLRDHRRHAERHGRRQIRQGASRLARSMSASPNSTA